MIICGIRIINGLYAQRFIREATLEEVMTAWGRWAEAVLSATESSPLIVGSYTVWVDA